MTKWTRWKKAEKVYEFLRERIRAGQQLYIVCPLVEESEKLPNLAAVEERFPVYRDVIFKGLKCGLLHGRMSPEEKEQVMLAFERGEIQILIATTVIEVGIDVPNASLFLIENAERFGLSQLHQLRGRIGRGDRKGYCILMTHDKLGEVAEKRMQVMESTCDGFQISEEDLGIRGPGELLGTRQSGALHFRLANLVGDRDILLEARQEAWNLLDENPTLEGEKLAGLRKALRDNPFWTA